MVSSIEVAVRVRPPLQINQLVEDVCVCAVPNTKQVIVGNQACFGTDYAFPVDCTQGYLYDTCISQKINYLLEGNDIAVISFGRCKSGKTYSLIGPLRNYNEGCGIIPRASRHVFNTLSRLQQHMSLRYRVFLSIFEVCNGEIKDLLEYAKKPHDFLASTNEKEIGNPGIGSVQCQNFNEVFNYINLAIGQRASGWYSSIPANCQSHCFFIFTVHQQWFQGGKVHTKVSRATFIDLGSSGATSYLGPNSQIVYPNSNKNVSLRVVSNILSMLAEDECVIPGSSTSTVLATLLKDAITFSYQTLLLCCLSPASIDHSDTLNYLSLVEQIRMILAIQSEQNNETGVVPLDIPFDTYEHESIKADSFGLEFAASQWQLLVANAEGLFQKLVQNGLSDDSRTQIEQWLCLKQECEECFNNETSIPVADKTVRSLERIDEVTESETKTSSAISNTATETDNESVDDYDELQKDELCGESISSKKGENIKFAEKLEIQINMFRAATDLLVNNYLGNVNFETEAIDHSAMSGYNLNSLNRRRRSVLPCEVFPQPSLHSVNPSEGDWEQSESAVSESGPRRSFKERMKQKFKKSEKSSNAEEIAEEDKVSSSQTKPSLNNNHNKEQTKVQQAKEAKDTEVVKHSLSKALRISKNESTFINSRRKMHKFVKLLKMEEDLKINIEKSAYQESLKNAEGNDNPSKSENTVTKENITSERHSIATDKFREDSFRHEIINLRDTRDILMEQRCSLDSKLNKDKIFTNDDERKFLEVDEAIEAIDAAIEHKNELLCGHKGLEYKSVGSEKGEIMLMDRLLKLSEQEMRCLLYKYFKKAVDLRESGRKMEQQLTDQEYQIETQTWKIQALCNALQQARIESERRLIMVHREHEEKLHLMYRHYTQNSSAASSSVGKLADGNSENSCPEPQFLELPDSFANNKSPQNALTIPQQYLKKLQGSSTHTTKVTRKKNKLIIQQQRSKKNTKL